jgi:hypothetical protein
MELIKQIRCPLLLIHGKQDEMIPWTHSLDLLNTCTSPAKLITPEKMKHNKFSVYDDIILHLMDFFELFIENELVEMSEMDESEYIAGPERAVNFPLFMFAEPQ